ncbi:TonB family protein [Novosphingobium flavum]|uniref:TonB family protein n=2 Tax=Novosphingobium flavum TaxID=1778672 RepID=A0A7X1KL18_9SPHN|nr:TonB family protein [Novosphingobium flavum]
MVLALAAGLAPRWQQALAPALTAVDFVAPKAPVPPPPPKQPPPRPTPESAPTGSPAPRNLRNKATPVFTPPVQPPLVTPPPIVAAPLPNLGNAAQTGASDLAGPGTGAGGIGNGTGGGGSGGNGNGGAVTGPRQIRGNLSYGDLPQGLVASGQEAAVAVRYTVNPDGTASNCRIDESSGFPALDATACRLIEQRFRFRPARDRAGKAVSSTVAEEHVWVHSPEGE